MDKEVLIAIREREDDFTRRVESILRNRVPRIPADHIILPDIATNEAEARTRIARRRYDLVIAHVHLAVDERSALVEEDRRGLELLASSIVQRRGTSSILIAPPGDDLLWEKTQGIRRCKLVPVGQHFEDKLIESCREALYGAASNEKEPGATVHFTFDLDRNLWTYRISARGIDEVYKPYGELEIETDVMDVLAFSSCKIEGDDWEGDLRRIGKALAKQIFRKTPGFIEAFSRLQMLVRNQERIRFHFTVEKRVHPVALEAALCEDREFLMLKAPIYRSLDVHPVVYPLFTEPDGSGEEMNCLIIVSDTSGLVWDFTDDNGRPVVLEKLGNLHREANDLRACFVKHCDHCRFGRLEVIPDPERTLPGDIPFKEQLKHTLTSHTWDLVHYAGHTYFKERAGKGYVMLPGEKGIDAVDMEIFSSWLRQSKTRFVYFSSCKSSNVAFVFEAASKRVPAILGFRWDIDDDMAAEHACCFYERLFGECRSLEYAFLETRKHMHETHKDNRIWASAILIVQTKD